MYDDLITASMDNQAMRDDTQQSNSTHPKSKVLVRMESVVSSVTSTAELVEANSATSFSANAKAGKIRAMISNRSRKMLLAVICLLSIGIVTMTALYLLEYHKEKESVVAKVRASLHSHYYFIGSFFPFAKTSNYLYNMRCAVPLLSPIP